MLVEWFEVKNNIYACLELGCAEIRIIVCNIREERLYVLSKHSIRAEGIENGNVINVNQVVQQLKTLKKNVEADLKQEVQQVLVAIPTVDASIENVVATIDLELNQAINSANIKQIFRNVINQSASQDQVVVSIVPRSFKVDRKNAVQNPKGIIGRRLSLDAQKTMAPAMLVYNLINVVELAGFRVADIILGSVVEALYIPNSQVIRKGICHVNIGKSMTTITVLHSGKADSTNALSIGGQNVTQDISDAFEVTEEVAEMLKLNFGRINFDEPSNEIIYVNEVEGKFICITRQMLEEVVMMRYERIFKVIKQYLNQNAYKSADIQYVLTGGASEMTGGLDLAKEILGPEVMVFRPSMLGVRHAKYSKLVAMAIFAHEMSLLTEQKSNIIDLSQYEAIQENSRKEMIKDSNKKLTDKVKTQEKSFMDHKLENSGVLVRLFDMIFDEKAK